MKTKQVKEELEQKNDDEITPIEPKTRARKKATDANEDDKNKPGHDEPRTSRDIKRNPPKSTKPISKRPLGIRKTLRNKKSVVVKDKIKNVIKQAVKRGRKPAPKVTETENTDKGAIPLIPACEIKKEPIDDTISTSRSSSPKTAGRRQRLTSDMIMMKAVLGDSPNSLVLGPRTSPYSMRSERSNSPSLFEAKNLRSGKPRKVKNNLLNEVVMKEQKKRRRLLSDSKTVDSGESTEACKKLKRVRSCSRDGSEISKCSDITESDISLSEPLNDSDSKEVNKKIEKPKTDVDLDVENNIQISSIEKVPSKLTENKQNSEISGILNEKNKRKLSLKRSTSLDSDNNNSNRLKLDSLNTSDIEEKLLLKTDNDILLEDRSSILTSMSKTFNSKEMSKNIRKARRGRKAAAASRPTPTPAAKNGLSSTETVESPDEKPETLESLSKEIDELITNLDQNIDCDIEIANNSNATENTADQMHTKSVSKFYGMSKPLGDNNSIIISETPAKEAPVTVENAPSKEDDTENIRLHYQESSADKSTDNSRQEITYKCTTVASIDKLMDRLKEFEEFDKRRQRQESESKSSDSKQVMVTNDVVLIPKSGADIKPLKDIQSVRSPEKPIEKENVLSCFENNSAISILKRDQVRKSIDVELPNSVTLIKRNSVSARKESTSSNHSRESDAISIFEKSLGKDVTLTEIRKSVDKTALTTQNQVDLHPFATLHPNNPTQSIVGVVLDSSQISITPRVVNESKPNYNDVPMKHKSIDALSRKSTESCVETEEKMATLERIKSPPPRVKSPVVCLTSLPTPVAVKSPECTQTIETEALAPPLDNVKTVDVDVDDNIPMTTEVSKVDSKELPHATNVVEEITPETESQKVEAENKKEYVQKIEGDTKELKGKSEDLQINKQDSVEDNNAADKTQPENDNKTEDVAKTIKNTKMNKSARNSIECQPGPSNVLHETPESQKRKESLLRTIGLLTHKAAKEVKIEKLKEKERIYGSSYNNVMNKAKAPASKSSSGDYTGTLKTVIKLNRGSEKKKYRSSLKMTFQKSKNRSGKPAPDVGEAADEDDAYYTIERREGSFGTTSDGVARKSYSNRLNIHDTETAPEPAEPSKETINLVIPEKASSFSIHPGRLCMDQCFYCGGKFGLFDTPCHIAQMKSAERQRKVLNNEEKLTIDSCLCDACYRHVDRRANCPSYRKKPTVKQLTDVSQQPQTSPLDNSQAEKSISPSLDDDSEEEPSVITTAGGRPAICHTEGCPATATHSIRRKWVIKMRNSINKVLKLEGDYPGLHTIPLCGAHHRALAPLMSCALCRRRIAKHSNLHIIHHSYTDFNPLLREVGIPVEFTDRPVLCKACRCYCNLLQKPGLNDQHARFYRRKLLRIYNIDVPPDSDIEAEEQNIPDDGSNGSTKQKKKARTKSKQRKSSDPDKLGENEQERISESPPEKEKKDEANSNEAEKPTHHLEEDIESLISSNKILVPPSVKHITNETNPTSDGSENETMDIETPIIPIDKQTELQYLLQKQNNPAQFLQKTNLQQKHRNSLKVQNLYGIQKPGLQYRIHDKNTKKLQKITQNLFQKEKIIRKENEIDIYDTEKSKDGICILKNITLNEECTIESIPNKKPADINTLKNKWQMSESFTQVKKNLSELSKKLIVEKEPKKSDAKYSNPVKRLETNPSISVRELFPGEEEMNLQCNIEFNNVKGVTPEGWEKCNTTIQYDQTTKKLFNELQRPYGNLSSFLRHLVLLEKYYRSGDLVLSHNASTHAANYSDSVQSRLRAYDNIINDAPRRSEPAISLIEFRKKPSTNGKSLLKSNQNDLDKDLKKSMPPPGILPKPKSIKSSEKVKSKTLPPELIAINTPNAQGRKAIQNVLHNIQQLVKGVSASDPIEVASAPLPVARIELPKEKKETPKPEAVKKQKTTSKPWRPTLMPITPENLARIAREPTQIAVDGRSLPSLVQVMSSGKRYHITLQDYNKMCIMRREKLQQLQDGDSKKKSSNEPETVVTEVQTSTMLGNGGTVVQNISPNKETQEKPKEVNELQIGANAATILKNVGLKNITIAPITQKTATVTSQTLTSPIVTSPSFLVTSTPIKIPQLGSAVSITSETLISSNSVITSPGIVMPKIPKSLTVIPQTVVASIPQNVVVTSTNVTPSVASVHNMDGQRP